MIKNKSTIIEFVSPVHKKSVFINHSQVLQCWPTELKEDLYCIHCSKKIPLGSTPRPIPVGYDPSSKVYQTFSYVCPPKNGYSCSKAYILEHPDFCSEVNLAMVSQLEFDMFGDRSALKPELPRAMMSKFLLTCL
jgi:hypothetical protein